jgi:hypothetical protein
MFSNKSRKEYVAVLFVLILSCTLSVGQNKQSSSTSEQSVPKTGTISGKVVNESGEPLSDVFVSVRPFGSVAAPRVTTTTRDGNFQFSGLAPVVYLLSANLSAYTPAPRDPDSTQATSYRIGDNVTLVLLKGGVVTGRVTSSSGEPVVRVSVRAQMISDAYGQPTRYGAYLREHTTDDRGVYRIYGLPTGTYLVMAGGGFSYSGFGPYSNDAPTYAPSSKRDTASQVSVQTGAETTNVDIRYRGESGHNVRGIASGPQGPDSAFSITLTSTLDAGSQWSEGTSQPPGSQGFLFTGVADGDYDLTAQAYFPNGERALSVAKRIRVRGADVSGVELVTQPLSTISGRVVLEDSKAAECKGKRRAVVTETLVSAWHNLKEARKDQPQFIWGLGGPIYPNEHGDLTLRNLAPGQYQIVTRLFAKYWYLQSITLPASTASGATKSIDAVANWTTLRQGERLSGMVVTLAEGAGSLQGRLTLNEGEKLPGRLYIYLVPVEREKEQDVLRLLAAPIADGQFTVNHIPPGRYWITTRPALEGAIPTLTRLRLPDEKETRTSLRRDAEAEKLEIEVKPCQNVTDYQLALKPAFSGSSVTPNH